MTAMQIVLTTNIGIHPPAESGSILINYLIINDTKFDFTYTYLVQIMAESKITTTTYDWPRFKEIPETIPGDAYAKQIYVSILDACQGEKKGYMVGISMITTTVENSPPVEGEEPTRTVALKIPRIHPYLKCHSIEDARWCIKKVPHDFRDLPDSAIRKHFAKFIEKAAEVVDEEVVVYKAKRKQKKSAEDIEAENERLIRIDAKFAKEALQAALQTVEVMLNKAANIDIGDGKKRKKSDPSSSSYEATIDEEEEEEEEEKEEEKAKKPRTNYICISEDDEEFDENEEDTDSSEESDESGDEEDDDEDDDADD